MVHIEDYAFTFYFLVGAGHYAALSLRPIDAVGLENFPAIFIDLRRSDGRLFTCIWQFAKCIDGLGVKL